MLELMLVYGLNFIISFWVLGLVFDLFFNNSSWFLVVIGFGYPSCFLLSPKKYIESKNLAKY
jgi:hypothetical protein